MNMLATRVLRTRLGCCAIFGLSLGACAAEPETSYSAPRVEAARAALRPLTTDEALVDFDQMVSAFRSTYGALERKEQRYGFKLDELAETYRARLAETKSEPEAQGILVEFISRFEDAHVGLVSSLLSDDSHELSLPFAVMPIEDTFVVYAVREADEKSAHDVESAVAIGEQSAALARGDELLSIDDVPAAELTERLVKYAGIPNDLSAKHVATLLLTQRPSYASAGIHDGDSAKVRVRGANGSERVVFVPWRETPHLLPPVHLPKHPEHTRSSVDALALRAVDVIRFEALALGNTLPFFLTPEVREQYQFSGPIGPSARALAKLGVAEISEAASKLVYAATYSHNGARNLLLRIASYETETDAEADGVLSYILALLTEQAPHVDGIVIDDSHNPGGNGYLAQNLVALLSNAPGGGLVQRMHGDRRWLEAYTQAIDELVQEGSDASLKVAAELQQDAQTIDAAYSSGQALTKPLAFPGMPHAFEPPAVAWQRKPLLVLTDELSASAAEVAALLIQANGVAPLFGERTVGAGGNVEPVAFLTNSQNTLALSRGVFTVFDPSGTYPESRYVEDIGVTPDVPYSHSLADFRAGYVGYVAAFSDALRAQTKHAAREADGE